MKERNNVQHVERRGLLNSIEGCRENSDGSGLVKRGEGGAVFPLRFWYVSLLKKLAVLACLTMAKLKIYQRVPNKNADLLKKISLIETEGGSGKGRGSELGWSGWEVMSGKDCALKEYEVVFY